MLEQLPKKYQIPRNLSLYMIHVHSVYTVTLGKCITTKSLCPILNHFNIREKVKICKELDRKIRQIVGAKSANWKTVLPSRTVKVNSYKEIIAHHIRLVGYSHIKHIYFRLY